MLYNCFRAGRGPVKRIASTAARKNLAEIIDEAYFKRQVTVLTHYGEDRAAIVPADAVDIAAIEAGKRKAAQSVPKSKS